MKPNIIALVGPKGVGKSTVANALLLNPNVNQPSGIFAFAAGLKLMLSNILPTAAFTPEGKENIEYGLCGRTPRHLMQTLGTEWGRNQIGENVWVEVMENRIKNSGLQTIIIDDMRFENEWAMVKRLGGTVIAIERAGMQYTGEHESEKGLAPHLIDTILDLDKVSIECISRTFNPLL